MIRLIGVPAIPLVVPVLAAAVFLGSCGGRPLLRDSYHSWPREVEEVTIARGAREQDQAQRALVYRPRDLPDSTVKVPLLIYLHGWSHDYRHSTGIPYAVWAHKKRWAFVAPNFRGPFGHSRGMGSPEVLRDILDARDMALSWPEVDSNRVFLLGVSGGASTALLLAAQAPHAFQAVSAWVPITDFTAWSRSLEGKHWKYGPELRTAFGGGPDDLPEQDSLYRSRSPISHVEALRDMPLDLHVGILDGKTGPVPPSQGLRFFQALCGEDSGGLDSAGIAYVDRHHELPPHWRPEQVRDYRPLAGLMRRSCNKARLTIFRGGHQMLPEMSLRWLDGLQQESR